MIKGTVYLVLIAMLVFACIVGEIMYRVKYKRLIKEHLNPEFFISRFDTYPKAAMIASGIAALIAIIVGMINTWNDPIQ